MKKKPKGPTTGIVVGIIGVIVIGIVGVLIYFAINRARDVTPTETEAGTCCSCSWLLELEGGTTVSLGSAGGVESGDECLITARFPGIEDEVSYLGEYKPLRCSDLLVSDVFQVPPYGLSADDPITAEETRDICEGGCILSSSDPLVPPLPVNETNNDVTFTAVFELRYATEDNTRFTDAEMIFEYPEGRTSPSSITADSLEKLTSYYENDNENLEIVIYEATFSTTWDTVLDYENADGIYKVKFRAQDQTGTWTEDTECSRNLVVPTTESAGNACVDLDFAPISGPADGSDTMDVTFNVYAEVPDPEDVRYRWQLDLNCDGDVSGGTGESTEEFTTGPDDTSVTRTFTYPANVTGGIECPVSVDVEVDGGSRTLSEVTPGSCSGYVRLTQVSEDCGNGECDAGEYCETNGNLECPDGTALPVGTTCSELCTYCGDGVVNGTEECDPGIEAGETGYEPLCRATCTIGTTPDSGEEEEETPSSTGTITITQDTPECVELVAPNNTAPITITVTNDGSEDLSVRAVSDTLPQGMTYQAGSTQINGVADNTDTDVTVEESGDSQLITWDNGGTPWLLGSGSSLAVTFTAVAGTEATIGSQTNRVTVTPADENPIPSQSPILLGQTCAQPLTGLFDRNARLIIIGSAFLFLAGAGFYVGIGNKPIAFILDKASDGLSTVSESAGDIYLRLTKPQKYMEKRVQKSAERRADSHSKKKS